MFDKTLRIGTRDSQLALWQARKVGDLLQGKHLKTQLVPTKSVGDLNLTQPIYAMGIQGVFTKALDIALLENRIDLAVHSLKDVPTPLPSSPPSSPSPPSSLGASGAEDVRPQEGDASLPPLYPRQPAQVQELRAAHAQLGTPRRDGGGETGEAIRPQAPRRHR